MLDTYVYVHDKFIEPWTAVHPLDNWQFSCNQFVISTGAAMGLWPTQGDEKRFGPAATLYATIPLSFVIPSEAEGSAVPRTFPGNAEILSSNRIVISTGAQRSGEICGFFSVPPHPL
jgi:hypothetical protein